MAPRGGRAGVSRFVGGKGGSEVKLLVAVVVRGARMHVDMVLGAHCAPRRGSSGIVMMASMCMCVLDWIVCCCFPKSRLLE